MPMSWKHGSQLTITSVSRSKLQPTTMASALATMLECVICTALGEPVEPEVSCISATSSSQVSSGSIGAFANSRFDRQHRHAEFGQHRRGGHERVGDDDGLRRDHIDHGGGLFCPSHQVSAGRGLVHHGRAGTAHPDALGGRSDLDRGARQHGDGVTMPDARCSQPAGHPTGPFVHFGPGMTDWLTRLPGDHALRARQGVAVHRFSESTQDNPFGLGATTPCVGCSGDPARNG